MGALTKEQIEQKKQQLAELSDEELKEVTGGYSYDIEKDLERISIELAKPEAKAAMKQIEELHRRREEERKKLEAFTGGFDPFKRVGD